MSLFQEISDAWPEFRELAGVDVKVDGETVEAVLLADVRSHMSHLEHSSSGERETQLAFRCEKWDALKMGEETGLAFNGREWRVVDFSSNPLHPVVFATVVSEGDA